MEKRREKWKRKIENRNWSETKCNYVGLKGALFRWLRKDSPPIAWRPEKCCSPERKESHKNRFFKEVARTASERGFFARAAEPLLFSQFSQGLEKVYMCVYTFFHSSRRGGEEEVPVPVQGAFNVCLCVCVCMRECEKCEKNECPPSPSSHVYILYILWTGHSNQTLN